MLVSVPEILNIRGLLCFSGVMFTVPFLVSMSVHFRVKANKEVSFALVFKYGDLNVQFGVI